MQLNQEKHLNNFDLLRLIAASFVFFSHCFNVYGKYDDPIISSTKFSPITFGSLGVSIFFVISGFLVTKSFVNTDKAENFLIKRILRLYPAVFFNLIIVYCLIAPLTTTATIYEYFKIIQKNIPLLLANSIFFQFPNLPHIFTTNPTTSLINLPLWTLFYEFMCYIVILICGSILSLKKTIPLITIIYIAYYYDKIFFPLKTLTTSLSYLYILLFLLGSCLFLYKRYIHLNKMAALLCLIGLIIVCFNNIYLLPLYTIFLPYLVIYAAIRFKYLGNWAKYGDFSYGLYIYSWPIQQTIGISIGFDNKLFPIYMIISFILTLIFAVFSWHIVERPALTLKPKS